MHITSIDTLINDQEINYLADLFLARYGFDTATNKYRLFRNAVILFSHNVWDAQTVYTMLAEHDGTDAAAIVSELNSAVAALQTPMHETFNKYYATSPPSQSHASLNVTMADNNGLDYILGFLGAVFLLIILTNYSKYDYVVYEPNK